MFTRTPLWTAGPLCFLVASRAAEMNQDPRIWLGVGLVLTLVFTVPFVASLLRD